MRRITSCLLLFSTLLGTPLLAAADPRYAVIAIGGADSYANGINNLGQVVGSLSYGGDAHAFVWTDGVLTDIGLQVSGSSYAAAINDHGIVVGNGGSGGYVYSGGGVTTLPGDGMTANGINNGGTIVGQMWYTAPDGELYRHGYSYLNGTVTDLGTLPIGDDSRAFGINSAGDIVGAAANVFNGAPNRPEDPFLYHNGVMTSLGNFGGVWSGATAINDLGQVVGFSGLFERPGSDQLYPANAFLYDGGVLHNIGALSPLADSAAYDINNLGQVVGISLLDGLTRAFLYDHGSMVDLNALIDPASGWLVESARGINDLGQIAARACKDGICQAVRLDLIPAVPEPPMVALLLAGVAFVGRRRVR